MPNVHYIHYEAFLQLVKDKLIAEHGIPAKILYDGRYDNTFNRYYDYAYSVDAAVAAFLTIWKGIE